MNTFPSKYLRLAGNLADPADPLILPVEVGGHADLHGEYHRWAKYTVAYDARLGLYEADGAIEVRGGDTDTLFMAATDLPALYSVLVDLEVAF